MTSANRSSQSAPIFTSLTIQATHPPLVRHQKRKYRLGSHTPKLATVPYEHWLHSVVDLLDQKGILSIADLGARMALIKDRPESENGADKGKKNAKALLKSEMVPGALAAGHTSRVDVAIEPRFKVGQRVRAKNRQFLGHTRLVGYVKGKVGIVATDFGVFTLPDTMAHGGIPTPQHVYSIAFTSDELWGPEADPKNSSRVGLWEDYLDAVGDEVSA